MFRITLKGLVANKVRLLLTSLAIVLGVGFISGSFVLADTLNKTFDNLFASAFEGIDVIVQGQPTVSRDNLPPIPEDLLATVRAVDGVRAADGQVAGQAVLVKDGKAIDLQGAPALGFSWDEDPEINSFQLRDGRAPEGPDEIVIDAGTVGRRGFRDRRPRAGDHRRPRRALHGRRDRGVRRRGQPGRRLQHPVRAPDRAAALREGR